MTMRAAASLVEVDWESMPAPADRAVPQALPPQERSEAHRPPCSTRRETSRACHPSAPAGRARTSIGHTPRAREGVSEQGETHRPPAAGFTLFDYLYLRAGRKGEVPLGVLRAGGGPSVLRNCQLLGLVLHHLGGHGDNAACLAKLLGDGGGAKRLGGAPRWLATRDEGVLVTGSRRVIEICDNPSAYFAFSCENECCDRYALAIRA